MRLAILIFVAILALATTQARAQGTSLETRMIKAICSSKATPVANTDRLARRLNLSDSQKAMLKDLTDTSASAAASAKKSLCADKMDFSTTPSRMALAQKMTETRLAGLKAVEPKLQAFYDSLDAKQKNAFDTGGRVGGIIRLVGQEIKDDWRCSKTHYARPRRSRPALRAEVNALEIAPFWRLS